MNAKKVFACLLVSFMAVTLFGCGKAGETVPEETTAPETAAVTLSEEELDKMAGNMPEIVFVMSHHFDSYVGQSNILGFYITNTGEMKMYDFRNIAPDEMYELPDVYDRLEEATCSEIIFLGMWSYKYSFTEEKAKEELVSIPKDELIEYYKKLLSVTGEAEYKDLVKVDCDFGDFRFYGIRNNENGERECILVGGSGDDYMYDSEDEYIKELYYWTDKKFPTIPLYSDVYDHQ
ncbi:MAG: hypothetical protein K2J72_04925 [Oscillospiraceae bacterium]|nr:hypothetical protein [Oscillospiraceae bacterium]